MPGRVQGSKTEEIWWHLLSAAHRQARRVGMAHEDAEDCAASFASQAIRRRDRVLRADLPPEQAEAWLVRCATNWCLNFARALRRRSTIDLDQLETSARQRLARADRADPCTASALRAEVLQMIGEAIGLLAPERGRIFISHCIEGKSVSQIADDLSTSPGAVRVGLHRARRQVQNRLSQRGVNDRYLR